MKTLKVGIASYEETKARSLAIARGEYKPKRGEPKVWFLSLESFVKVFSDRNRVLLKTIAEEEPDSLTELAEISGHTQSNLLRTLHALEQYGFVRLEKSQKGKIVPHALYSKITLAMRI